MAQSDDGISEIRTRLDKVSDQQGLIIGAIDGQTDCIQIVGDKVSEVMAWLQEPPSSDMADTLRQLAEAVRAMHEAVVGMQKQIAELVAGRQ